LIKSKLDLVVVVPQWHGGLNKRKSTGGKRRPSRSKRSFEQGNRPAETTLGEKISRERRGLGGKKKTILLSVDEINVTDPKTNRTQKVKIEEVLENPANVDYNRRGVITRGAVVKTELGNARITSRPGQSSVVNGILI
jgi:small subunit ribosomal protein S8e